MKKFLAAVLLIGMLISITAVSAKSDVLRKEDIVGEELRKNEVESYRITHFKGDKVFVRVYPEISGKGELLKYVNKRIATIKYLSSTRGDTAIDAVITFNDKYPIEAYKSFMEQYALKELSYMCQSYPEGTGVLSNEIPVKTIEEIEKDIGRNYKEFRLIDGVASVKTRIPAKDLLRIQNDPKVFLIDAGHVDVYKDNPNKEIRVAIDYIYPVYAKLKER